MRLLALEMVRVTEAGALAAARLMGRGDTNGAGAAAATAVRAELSFMDLCGTVVTSGETSGGIAMGDTVGTNASGAPAADVAVMPLEGRAITARGDLNALSYVALGAPGSLLRLPEMQMEKIVVGADCAGLIDLSRTPTENIYRIAARKDMPVSDVTVCILNRPRNAALLEEVRAVGARVRLIRDGDVSAALAAAVPTSPVDVLMGIGGSQEGVVSAAALRALGGDMQARLHFRDDSERAAAAEHGLSDVDAIFRLRDLAAGDVIFAATGVTDGDYLTGVRLSARGARTHSVVMRSMSGTVRTFETKHDFTRGHGRPRMPSSD